MTAPLESPAVMPWVIFLLSATAIVAAGAKLSQYGDQIAEYSGLGRVWIGVVLIAGATSLPEILTDINAALLGEPNLAVGDLFGSNMANMCILGLIDLVHRRQRVWRQAAYEHVLSAALAVVLTGLAALFIFLRPEPALWGVGLDSALIMVIYILGMRVVYRQETLKRQQQARERVVKAASEEETSTPRRRAAALRRASISFALAACVILLAAPFLAASAKEIAEITGIGATFIGSSLVAVTTSLPELVSALAAVRLGAFDLAVGNLFGSNAVNMSVLFLTDIAYRSGPLLSMGSAALTGSPPSWASCS